MEEIMEVLSQDEIDQLLSPISPILSSLEEFETFLVKRQQPKEPYGIFAKEVTMCRFFDSQNGETILADIESKNEAQGMGNFLIPETNIKLINYSVCPRCGRMFSFKDLMDYYANPKRDVRFSNRAHQYRNDTRVFCHECGAYFLPALVIADGTPKNEVQFLCRVQTANAIEAFYQNSGKNVLSAGKNNILKKEAGGKTIKAIKNDVLLKDMSSKPTLISNLLQYTPANLALNLINGTNYQQGDVLFGTWQ
jgi:ribosomal protein L32